MPLRQRIAKLVAVQAVTAAAVSVSVFAAGPAMAQTLITSQNASAASSGFGDCASGYWCDYVYDNGYDVCFKVSPFAGPGDVPNWGAYGCRNVDGAIYNDSPFTLRIYYGPNYRDPHACIDPFTKIRDLFNYDFNSGSGSHNLVIGNDIASSTISLTTCTNPL